MKLEFEHRRALSIIEETIVDLSLNLREFEILTEVGSHNYIYTPIIAALAGAKKVNAWTSDSAYGKALQIKNECFKLADHLGLADRINIETSTRPIEQIRSADIVTNSGFLRPINKSFIDSLKSTAVVPLMYEAWEYRKEDVDVPYCLQRGIKVAGTWEDHPSIRVFEKIGALCLKLALASNFEISQNSILVWSDDNFGKEAYRAFELLRPKNLYLTNTVDSLMKVVADLDFIFICDYDEERVYFGGTNPIFDLHRIQKINDRIGIIHLYGSIDYEFLSENGIKCFPMKNGRAKVMSETLGYLGLLAILKLQVAGFKVGELLLKNQKSNLLQELNESL